MFDKSYNYMTDLESDSFFGDHQVMLDLKAGFLYKNVENKCKDGTADQLVTTILKIDKEVFINLMLQDEDSDSYEYYHKLAL